MRLYNTLSKEIEAFVPLNDKEVTLYTCGPTVYNYAHIGNLRTYIFEDILEKTLKYLGYNVKRVMNITDMGHLEADSDSGEDKMIKAAKKEQKSVQEIAQYYTEVFFKDEEELNIKKAEIIVKASDHIEDYIKVILKLIEKGYAYQANGNVYFDVSKMEDYYKLSGKNADDLNIAVREEVTEDLGKKNPFDFGLWFTNSKFKDQIITWDSPWGKGYPGWHIECSTIASVFLGEYLDIHCGGVDNIFPHHSNEIVQSEAYFGHKWCNYWLHGEHLNTKEGKMSKSTGDFLTLSLLKEKGYNPLSYRYFCLGSHYRNQLVFSYESLDSAEIAYNKLKERVLSLTNDGELDSDIFKKYNNQFKEALSNDLNTSNALTCIYDLLKEDTNDKTKKELVFNFEKVLSLDLFKENEISDELKKFVEEKIKERNTYKELKDYKKADIIRDELQEKGISILDSREGTSWKIER